MKKTGFNAMQISNDIKLELKGVTSLTVANYGSDPLKVIVNDTPFPVLAFNTEIGVPYGSFNIPGDGTACDITLEIKFSGASKNSIISYRKLLDTCNI
ncbi:hypothetical protein V1389_02000 [Flavobacterium rakeshii]|uniref:hypothetical protein n=1 Tax=Flavobacterium rakeshii TaxID=1038845 RepID=UPI002E7BB3BF|nr:hypothetical protein [Flavobacterium rakeshii]MEE1897089.1 hypothetical protein [Flavobacterium rakeshii]